MVLDIPYVSLTHTLKAVKQQVRDSLPHIGQYVPYDIRDPQELFEYLKPKLTFRNDPDGDEYVQTVRTLFNKNNGYGDCDCFTVLALTSFIYLRFKPIYVQLAGKSHLAPTHIYTAVYDASKQKICAFDLTNPIYNMERKYNFQQRLLFQL